MKEMKTKKMKARNAYVRLRYKGGGTMDITEESSGCTIVDCASGEADTISVSLFNKSGKWFKKNYFPKSSDYIRATIVVDKWKNDSEHREVYQGKFVADQFAASGFPATVDLEGMSIPLHTGFNVTQRSKTYKKTSLKSILQIIAKRACIKLVFEASNHKVDEVSQDGNTDLEFAFSICSDYGCCMKLYNGKMIIYDQTAYERKASRFTLNKSDLGDDSTYNFTRSVSKVYDSVKFQYQNKKGKNITYNYNIPGRTGRRTLFISSSADSHADAEKKAKAQLASTLREAITASFTVMGDPKYRACRWFRVTGFGKFNGRYFIDKVTHNFSDEGYTSTIECHKCVTNIR